MKVFLAISAFVSLLAILSTACGYKASPGQAPDGNTPAELRQYGEESLSSWMDFRENSIIGPQNIDLSKYSLEVTGMVEIFPGAISIKFATYTGYKVAGIPGAIVANIGNLLAPVLFIMVASLLYSRYRDVPRVGEALQMVRYAVCAMIVAVAIRLVDRGHVLEPKVLLAVVISFLLLTLTRAHPALIIVGAACYGGLVN